MFEKGFVGLAVLWMTAGLATIALSYMALARDQNEISSSRFTETQSVLLAHAAQLAGQAEQFEFTYREFLFENGRIFIRRIPVPMKDSIRLSAEVHCGKDTRQFEVLWRKIGGTWTAISWSESS